MRKWTQEELDFLRANYQSMGARECAQYLGRTIGSIHHKAERLDEPPKHRADKWTEEELLILHRDYPTLGAESVSGQIGRSLIAVRHRASRLHLPAGREAYERSTKTRRANATANGIKSLYIWAQEVKKRDDYTCQVCGLYEPLIVAAHHITPTAKGGARLDIQNGMTLCPNCHALEHAVNGKNISGKKLSPDIYNQIGDLLQQGVPILGIARRVTANIKTIRAISRQQDKQPI